MSPQTLSVEILSDWKFAEPLKEEWRSLQQRADTPSPFSSFEWLGAYYKAYCPPGKVRIILVRDREKRLRAILPGMLERRVIAGISQSCFVYPAAYYTPRCGVIALPGDIKAVVAALEALAKLEDIIHIVILPDIEKNSITWQAIQSGLSRKWYVRIENKYESPVYAMPEGWEAYRKTRSKNLRKRIRQSIKRCASRGPVATRVFVTGHNFYEGIERLRRLDAITWQGCAGNGVFNNEKDFKFFKNLCDADSGWLHIEIEILQIDGIDVAYRLVACQGPDVFLLRTGFDPAYGDCRPGIASRAFLNERLANRGVVNFDLGAGVQSEKVHWETFRRSAASFWLVNRQTVRGCLHLLEFFAYQYVKPIAARLPFKLIQNR